MLLKSDPAAQRRAQPGRHRSLSLPFRGGSRQKETHSQAEVAKVTARTFSGKLGERKKTLAQALLSYLKVPGLGHCV